MKSPLRLVLPALALLVPATLANDDYSYFITTWSTDTCDNAGDLTGSFVLPVPPPADKCGHSESVCLPFSESLTFLQTFLNADDYPTRPWVEYQLFNGENCERYYCHATITDGKGCSHISADPEWGIGSVKISNWWCRD